MTELLETILSASDPRISANHGGYTGNGITSGCERLNLRNGKIALVVANTPAWHKLGTVVQGAVSAADALRLGQLDRWGLAKLPLYCTTQDGRILESDMWGIVRQDTGQYLGTVGSRYEIVSNEDCFAIADDILRADYAMESAGALGKGENVWLLMKSPNTFSVGSRSDSVENYIMISTTHDGSGKVNIFPTTVRTVCQNTYTLAMKGRSKGYSMKHTKNILQKAEEAKRALGFATKAFDRFREQAERFSATTKIEPQEYFQCVLDDVLDVTVADVRVTHSNERNVLDAILHVHDAEARATEEKRYERAMTRRRELLSDILDRYESGHNPSNLWGAFNAVTEHADHSPQWKSRGTDRERAEARLLSNLNGQSDAMKTAAYDRAVAIANAN